VRLVVGISIGLTLFIASALGWLGWRLLTQEAAIEHQRERDRTEQIADRLVAAVLRNVIEAETSLGRVEHLGRQNLPPGVLFVEFIAEGVRTIPNRSLLYHPVVPTSPVWGAPHESQFREMSELEFVAKDYRGAALKLADFESSTDRSTVAEARIRLARILAKDGRPTEALRVYSRLVNDETPSAADVPYCVLARFARCQLLAASGARSVLREEASSLLRDLHSGRWALARDSYFYYAAAAKQLSEVALAPDAAQLAVTEAVSALWDDWRLFCLGHARVPGTRVHDEHGIALLALVKAEEHRATALMIPHAALAEFLFRGIKTPGSVSIVDGRGGAIFGAAPQDGETGIERSLSSAGIPWRLRLSASSDSMTTGSGRERPFIFGLAAIAAIVALACYAMARGVIRETRSAQLQTDFVSAVSHEFRSPLSGLRQLTEMLAHGRVRDESRRHVYFEALQKETARLQRLVEDLLDFGRMERQQLRYRFERLDFFDLVRESIPSWNADATSEGFQIEFAGANEAAPVRGDAESLRRVFRNLLENAMRYSPGCRTVWVETARENGNAMLRVRDRGIGIDRAEQRRIFEKFVRGEAATGDWPFAVAASVSC
jgi:hypothetical protein